MTAESKMIVRWILSGVAFLAVLGLAGCSMFSHGPEAAVPATQPVASLPPAVSVFGSFGRSATSIASGAPITGENFQQQTFTADGADRDVSVDPAGKWMVFASTRNSQHSDIYLQRVDGTSVVQLTDDPADDAFPTFSPDGKTIAFSSSRSGRWSIYTMDLDGRNVVQVTNGPGQDVHPSFSPDARQLVYSSLNPRSGQWELWTINLQNNQRRMIGYGLFPSWSPDKEVDRIAFQRARQRGSHLFGLWTLTLVNGEASRVTEVATSPVTAIVCPSWSPDGKKIAFATVAQAGATAGMRDIWVVDADGGKPRKLTEGGGSNLEPFWAVDNRVYFVSNRSGNDAIWSVNAGWDNPPAAAASAAAVPAAAPAVAEKPAPAVNVKITAKPAPVNRQRVGSADTGDVSPQ